MSVRQGAFGATEKTILKLMVLLRNDGGALYVNEILAELGCSYSTVSHLLRELQYNGFAVSERVGKQKVWRWQCAQS